MLTKIRFDFLQVCNLYMGNGGIYPVQNRLHKTGATTFSLRQRRAGSRIGRAKKVTKSADVQFSTQNQAKSKKRQSLHIRRP